MSISLKLLAKNSCLFFLFVFLAIECFRGLICLCFFNVIFFGKCVCIDINCLQCQTYVDLHLMIVSHVTNNHHIETLNHSQFSYPGFEGPSSFLNLKGRSLHQWLFMDAQLETGNSASFSFLEKKIHWINIQLSQETWGKVHSFISNSSNNSYYYQWYQWFWLQTSHLRP